jgi:hypothetical protein
MYHYDKQGIPAAANKRKFLVGSEKNKNEKLLLLH